MLIHTRFHRVLSRPQTIFGAEREPTLVTAILSGGLAITGMNVAAISVGVGLWLLTIPLLRRMAKADPAMMRVYARSLYYRGYYPPRSRPACRR